MIRKGILYTIDESAQHKLVPLTMCIYIDIITLTCEFCKKKKHILFYEISIQSNLQANKHYT